MIIFDANRAGSRLLQFRQQSIGKAAGIEFQMLKGLNIHLDSASLIQQRDGQWHQLRFYVNANLEYPAW